MNKGWAVTAVLVLTLGLAGCKLQAGRPQSGDLTEPQRNAVLSVLQKTAEAEHERTVRYRVNSDAMIQLHMHEEKEEIHTIYTGQVSLNRKDRLIHMTGEIKSPPASEEQTLEVYSVSGKMVAKFGDEPWQVVGKSPFPGLLEDPAHLSRLIDWMKQGKNKEAVSGLAWQDQAKEIVVTIDHLKGPFDDQLRRELSQTLGQTDFLSPELERTLAQQGMRTFKQVIVIDKHALTIKEVKQELDISLGDAMVARQTLVLTRTDATRETIPIPDEVGQSLN
ncbi:hypothetical protein [Laceyella putida]|uniref:LppX_LprAFG lipoprotein n=1 Tax=Laceyella putida TaxID=110101 RepID=A0ABW2RM63_9BACL